MSKEFEQVQAMLVEGMSLSLDDYISATVVREVTSAWSTTLVVRLGNKLNSSKCNASVIN